MTIVLLFFRGKRIYANQKYVPRTRPPATTPGVPSDVQPCPVNTFFYGGKSSWTASTWKKEEGRDGLFLTKTNPLSPRTFTGRPWESKFFRNTYTKSVQYNTLAVHILKLERYREDKHGLFPPPATQDLPSSDQGFAHSLPDSRNNFPCTEFVNPNSHFHLI